MCGLAGVLMRDGSPADRALVEAMGRALAHRGPDDAGILVEGPLGLAHRRLSILDPSPAGHQPMADPTGEVTVTYNGELYNTPALRAALEASGVRLRTGTDTECLPHLWRAHGASMVAHLRGMFAFALHDRRSRTLFLARDRFGQKPLYYAVLPDRILFASELKALVVDPAFPRAVDRRALRAYLALGYVPDPATIYAAARKLPPGHALEIGPDGAPPEPTCYWRLRFDADEGPGAEEWEARLEAKLEETVRAHLLSDVPLGAFLSGGVDSSTVVALMSRAGGRVRTFSIGFEEPEFSETAHARTVARHLGTEHEELIVRPDAAALATRLAEVYDEPFADSSAIPTFLVSELARRHVTVALSGDGGDELLAGYERYLVTARASAHRRIPLPASLRARILGPLARAWPETWRGGGFLTRLARGDANYVDAWLTVFGRRLAARSLSPEVFGDHDPLRAIEAVIEEARGLPLVQRLQSADLATYLPGDILVKVDRASMAHSLETRAPLLDHELAELVARIPARFLCDGVEGKILLKRIARRLVPREVVDRRKMGFAVPLRDWFRGELRPLVRDALLAGDRRTASLYRPGAVERILAEHDGGALDRSAVIWTMLVLELFWRRWSPALT